MDGAGAPEGQEREGLHVAALFGHVDLGGGGHGRRHDLVDAPGGGEEVEVERARHGADRAGSRVAVEPHLAAEEEVGVQVAEHEVGVRHRRRLATSAVAGGAGHGSRALRPHLQQPQAAHVGDAAAPGADLDEVDHGDLQRDPAALLEAVDARHLALGGLARLAVADDAALGRRATHVEGEQVGGAETTGEELAGCRAAGGAGLDHAHGVALRGVHRRDAAAREHDVEAPAEPGPPELVDQRGQVPRGDRLDVCVSECRTRALVLPDLGQDVGRERDEEARGHLARQGLEGLLVHGIGVGVQEGDRNGFHTVGGQGPQLAPRALLVEWAQDTPVAVDALGHFPAPAAGGERAGELRPDIVDVIALLAPDLDDVPEALGGHEGGRRALAFDDGVDHERGAVDHAIEAGREPGPPLGEARHALHDRAHQVVRGRARAQVVEPAAQGVVLHRRFFSVQPRGEDYALRARGRAGRGALHAFVDIIRRTMAVDALFVKQQIVQQELHAPAGHVLLVGAEVPAGHGRGQ